MMLSFSACKQEWNIRPPSRGFCQGFYWRVLFTVDSVMRLRGFGDFDGFQTSREGGQELG